MSWLYRQRTGELLRDGTVVAVGYSGWDANGNRIADPGDGVNLPASERIRGVGPIPEGRYRIGPPMLHPALGPYSMPLGALPGTQTFGRGGFYLHGDAKAHRGSASHGCIVMPRATRELVWASGDRVIEVVSGVPSEVA